MKITEGQLDEYIALYKKEYQVTLDRITALTQFTNLINLVIYSSCSSWEIQRLEQESIIEYNKDATHRA